jgi:hypothetical protein
MLRVPAQIVLYVAPPAGPDAGACWGQAVLQSTAVVYPSCWHTFVAQMWVRGWCAPAAIAVVSTVFCS